MRLITIYILILFLSGCSAKWHFQRAYKKDPSIFKVDTTTQVMTLDSPSIKFGVRIPCIEKPIELTEIREIERDGVVITDTVYVNISQDTVIVDCDPKIITKTVPEPYPVEVDKPIIRSISDLKWYVLSALLLVLMIVGKLKSLSK